jgi:hypothetical protein
MRGFRTILLIALAAVSVSLAQADQIPAGDPRVKTGGGGTLLWEGTAPAAIIIQNFSILTPSGTSPGTSPCDLLQGTINTVSPTCLFQNDISVNGVGQSLTMLTFDALGVDPNTVNCGFLSGSPFSQCGVDPLMGNEGTQITFFQGSIAFGSNFTLDFEGFPQNFTFGSTATTTPEPGTLGLLMLGGLAAMLAGRRVRAGFGER